VSEQRPPVHLGPAGRRLWRAVLAGYRLAATERAILQAGCEALDRQAEARALIDAEGLIIEGRYGPRAHPALAIERDARLALVRTLRALGVRAGHEGVTRSNLTSFGRGRAS